MLGFKLGLWLIFCWQTILGTASIKEEEWDSGKQPTVLSLTHLLTPGSHQQHHDNISLLASYLHWANELLLAESRLKY